MAAAPTVIWGAGAIGGTIGAFLLRAGRPVVLVDIVEEHVKAIADGKLTIEGPIANFTCGGPAVTPDRLTGQHKLILLAVKSHHTEAACRALLPHLAPDGAVASLQNGLNELQIAGIVGRQRTIAAFVNFSADYLEPGRITYAARSPIAIGELDGATTPRIRDLHRLLLEFEEDTRISDNVFGYLWTKSAYGTFQASSALTNIPMAEFMADPRFQPMLFGLIREVLAVARAERARPVSFQGFDPDAFQSGDPEAMRASLMANREFKLKSTKKHSGYWRDLAVRKRQTDITAQLAPVLALAKKHGIAMPLTELMLAQIGRIERGEREIGTPLAEELAALAATLPPNHPSPQAR